jgi:hypothetical protein
MASYERIIDNLAPIADLRASDGDPPHAEAATPAQAAAPHGVADAAPEGAQVGISAGTVARPETRAELPKLYLPACGALCDILLWARRST